MTFDLLLRRGMVIDPANGHSAVADVAVRDGVVTEVAESIDPTRASQVLDVAGQLVMPGLIDTHVHVSSLLGGLNGFRMLARAGVTTALDCAGPLQAVVEGISRAGAGLNIAVLNGASPGHAIASSDPSLGEIRKRVGQNLDEGAYGLKLMGGHYPLTPEATAAFIAEANQQGSYVAFHAGTTAHGSNYHGFCEALELAGDNAMHLAHINAYCRGVATGDPITETREALAALAARPNIVSEFHMATVNGTSGRCVDGVPESHVTRTCLRMRGYPETAEGLAQAFRDGYAHVTASAGGANVLLKGEEGLAFWQANPDAVTVGFPVNDRTTAFLCANGRHPDRRLIITALSTDGGGIPRNFLLKYGLLLVEFGSWTIEEFVTMTSVNPAAMLGLPSKGHLGPGADADITVADPARREAALTVVGGEVVMAHGVVTGKGGSLICTERGVAALRNAGLRHQVADMSASLLYSER